MQKKISYNPTTIIIVESSMMMSEVKRYGRLWHLARVGEKDWPTSVSENVGAGPPLRTMVKEVRSKNW